LLSHFYFHLFFDKVVRVSRILQRRTQA
jgi:hypothetical protein